MRWVLQWLMGAISPKLCTRDHEHGQTLDCAILTALHMHRRHREKIWPASQ